MCTLSIEPRHNLDVHCTGVEIFFFYACTSDFFFYNGSVARILDVGIHCDFFFKYDIPNKKYQ